MNFCIYQKIAGYVKEGGRTQVISCNDGGPFSILCSWRQKQSKRLLWWSSGKKAASQCRGHALIPDPGRSYMPWGSKICVPKLKAEHSGAHEP